MHAPSASPAHFPAEYGQTPESLDDLMSWDAVVERIAGARNYWLATTSDGGRPHLRPVDGVFVEGALCFGGSPETRWVRYLEARPHVSMSLPDDDQAVILEGTAELVSDPDGRCRWRCARRTRPSTRSTSRVMIRPLSCRSGAAPAACLRLVAHRVPGQGDPVRLRPRPTRFDLDRGRRRLNRRGGGAPS